MTDLIKYAMKCETRKNAYPNLEQEFINFMEYAVPKPNHWETDDEISTVEWIYNLIDDPPWQNDLTFDNNIDNCVGEFYNYHLGLGMFLEMKIREKYPNVNITFIEREWLDKSDIDNADRNLEYKIDTDEGKHIFTVNRTDSMNSRKSPKSMELFLRDQIERISSLVT